MILGIGVDTVNIEEIRRYLKDERLGSAYRKHTFTPAEIEASESRPDPAEYLASRFAAKEAVFKALAPLTQEKAFDLRIVETLNRDDGSPYVKVNKDLRPIMQAAGAERLFISITTEDNYATAFVIAEGHFKNERTEAEI